MTDIKLSIDALDFVFKNDLKIKLKVEFNVKLSSNLSLNSSDFSFFFFLAILNFFFLCRYLFQHIRFFMICSFTMRTLFKECEDVIITKGHDNRELITVNLRLINEFSH